MVKQLRRPDGTIHYEVYGQGPAIVFAHGLGGNHLSWWQQVPHFAQRHACVVFSHRGFTPSSAVPGATAPDAYADDLGHRNHRFQKVGGDKDTATRIFGTLDNVLLRSWKHFDGDLPGKVTAVNQESI